MNREFEEIETVSLRDEISICEDIEDVIQNIFPLLNNQQEEWKRKFEEILEKSGYTLSKLASLCNVSRQSASKWRKGVIPKNRETFLRIGMVAGYDLEKMNQLLQRYGRYPALYSKSMEDCICIYVITHNRGEEAIKKYDFILNEIKKNIIRDDNASTVENISTVRFDKKLSEVHDETDLEEFITDNIAMFANAYHKFYAYVKANIMANYMENDKPNNIFDMAIQQEWSSSLRACVSAIRQNKWYPTRNKIISLGLHLTMDHEQIDKMLELAHMEPLCAKNIFESVIMFILDDASLNDILDMQATNYDPNDLCKYASTILKKLNLTEVEDFLSELPEEDEDE